jgi:hypothetical protein
LTDHQNGRSPSRPRETPSRYMPAPAAIPNATCAPRHPIPNDSARTPCASTAHRRPSQLETSTAILLTIATSFEHADYRINHSKSKQESRVKQMRLIKLLTLTGLAVVALSAIMISTAAAAEIEYLGTFPNKFTSAPTAVGEKIQFSVLEVAPTVVCTTAEGTGEVTSAKETKFEELFLGCTSLVAGKKEKCTGLNVTVAGSILVKGKGLLGWASNKAGELVIPVIALKIEPEAGVHFECGPLGLALVKGCVLAELLNPNALVTTTSIHMRATAAGDQEFTKYAHKKGEKHEECVLLGSLSTNSEHKFVMASQEYHPTLTFSKVILLMV